MIRGRRLDSGTNGQWNETLRRLDGTDKPTSAIG